MSAASSPRSTSPLHPPVVEPTVKATAATPTTGRLQGWPDSARRVCTLTRPARENETLAFTTKNNDREVGRIIFELFCSNYFVRIILFFCMTSTSEHILIALLDLLSAWLSSNALATNNKNCNSRIKVKYFKKKENSFHSLDLDRYTMILPRPHSPSS